MEPIKHNHPNCWISPEEALEEMNSLCLVSEYDKPFKSTECFKVWGRGRPRPSISQIVLPKNSTTPTSMIQENRPINKGKGRGRLLLLEDYQEQVQENQTFRKSGLNGQTALNAIEEIYRQKNKSTTETKELNNNLFDFLKEFPALQ